MREKEAAIEHEGARWENGLRLRIQGSSGLSGFSFGSHPMPAKYIPVARSLVRLFVALSLESCSELVSFAPNPHNLFLQTPPLTGASKGYLLNS